MSNNNTWEQLAAPFSDDELEWKPQTLGRDHNGKLYATVVPYVQSRAIMDRLDSVVGPDCWQSELSPVIIGAESGFVCRLSIDVEGDNTWVWREDVCPATDIEAMKGAASGALKRVAVQFGIGRYLYNLPQYRIWSEDIFDGNPPKDATNVIRLYRRADQQRNQPEIKAWCRAPKIGVVTPAKPSAGTTQDDDLPFGPDDVPFDEAQGDMVAAMEAEERGHQAKPTTRGDLAHLGNVATVMASRYDNAVCAFCGERHITKGEEIVGVDGIPGKAKRQFGDPKCYEVWCKKRAEVAA